MPFNLTLLQEKRANLYTVGTWSNGNWVDPRVFKEGTQFSIGTMTPVSFEHKILDGFFPTAGDAVAWMAENHPEFAHTEHLTFRIESNTRQANNREYGERCAKLVIEKTQIQKDEQALVFVEKTDNRGFIRIWVLYPHLIDSECDQFKFSDGESPEEWAKETYLFKGKLPKLVGKTEFFHEETIRGQNNENFIEIARAI